VASQPFAAFASQLPNPAWQAKPQISAAHVAVAFAGTGQTVHAAPHAVATFVTHLPAQRWLGAVHLIPQTFSVHVAVPPTGTGQTTHAGPHASGLVFATQVPPHRWVEFAHLVPQTPFVHVAVPPTGTGHTVQVGPHAVGLVFATHVPAQAWKSGLHVNWHALSSHAIVAFATTGHRVLQPPQWLVLVTRSTQSFPHLTGASGVQPFVHWKPGPAGAQSGAATAHTALHAPQLVGFERSVSQPSAGFVLQSA